MTTLADQQPVTLASRASGVLLHISSLPSRHGIGDLGAAAFQFADALAAAGQRYWQVLPVNPTLAHAGESPYFSASALASNPLLIDLDGLVSDGLLAASEVQPPASFAPASVDFAAVRAFKLPLLQRAVRAFRDSGEDAGFAAFVVAEAHWLEDHALFTALCDELGSHWANWPEDLRRRDPQALAAAREAHAEAIYAEQVRQYFFARQWHRLRAYCRQRGVVLFGDMPIYVAYDSVDVWAHADVFELDEQLLPLRVSGVPPDYFSATGQLWNNPLYDWNALQATDFEWWQRRVAKNLEHFDLLRIDHFRGLVQYWAVPAHADTAIHGAWCDVPTDALFASLHAALVELPVVVEDLGTITADVVAARERYRFPGMVVLHFAFANDDPHNPHRPENHPENAVAYLGTHDNNTTAGWLADEVDAAARQRLADRLPPDWERDPVSALLELLLSSRPVLAIVAAQDLLRLPGSARMNDPATPGHNWHWRMTPAQLAQLPVARLRAMCVAAGRCAVQELAAQGDP